MILLLFSLSTFLLFVITLSLLDDTISSAILVSLGGLFPFPFSHFLLLGLICGPSCVHKHYAIANTLFLAFMRF